MQQHQRVSEPQKPKQAAFFIGAVPRGPMAQVNTVFVICDCGFHKPLINFTSADAQAVAAIMLEQLERGASNDIDPFTGRVMQNGDWGTHGDYCFRWERDSGDTTRAWWVLQWFNECAVVSFSMAPDVARETAAGLAKVAAQIESRIQIAGADQLQKIGQA